MKIQFLGTGAADWPYSKPADTVGEFRRLSSALIDGVLLIDPGPAVPEAMEELGLDPAAVRYVINTHRHRDHFNADTLQWLQDKGATFYDLDMEEEVSFGPYTVKSHRANHATMMGAKHFLVTDGKSKLYYALDGAWLLYGEVETIKAGVDLLVMDGTVGNVPGDYRIFEHNNLTMVKTMRETLAPYVGQFYISHLARTLHEGHDAVAAELAEHQIGVAYDGLTLEF